MQKKSVVIMFCCILVFGLLANPAFSAEKVFKWKYQTPNVESEPGWFIGNIDLKKMIEEGSGGRVQVKLYTMGSLVGMEETLNAVRSGVIEMGEYISGFAEQVVPACLISEAPQGGRSGKHAYDLYYKFGLASLLTKAYEKQAGVHFLAAPYFGYVSLLSTFPVNTVADLKGKAIWLAPHSQYLADFGAVHTEVPGFDMYMGLKLGTIDGCMWTWDGLESYKLKEVAKYVMTPSQVMPNSHVVVNKKAWDALGTDLQKKIQDHIDANIGKSYEKMDKFQDDIIVKMKAEGIQYIEPKQEDLAKLRAAARKYWDWVASKDAFSKEGIEIYKAFLKANNIPY